jgi:hypothetical protein
MITMAEITRTQSQQSTNIKNVVVASALISQDKTSSSIIYFV